MKARTKSEERTKKRRQRDEDIKPITEIRGRGEIRKRKSSDVKR